MNPLTIVCVLAMMAVVIADGYGKGGYGESAGYKKNIYHSQDGYGKYKFGYDTEDHHTGDIHGAHEEGIADHHHGNSVRGKYYLKDPYGYMRSVNYKSDGKHGGTYQMVKGSYNGLYVHSPYYSIVPDDKGGY